MKLLLINHIQNAQQSLKANRLRSVLTALGVTIGVASITTILALSGGASKIVSDQVDALGGNIAVIRPGVPSSGPITSLTQAAPHRDFSASTLTENDIALVKGIPHVELVAPLMIISGAVKAESTAPADTPIIASTPELADISALKLQRGQFLDATIKPNTAVIGTQLSINIFGTEDSIGKTVKIRSKPFTVVGVLKQMNNPINYNSVDFDNSVIINFASGKALNGNVAQIQQVNLRADSIASLSQIIIDSNKILLAAHGNENDFSILSGTQISQPTSQLFYAIAGITAAVAGISLLVGGIGIMNIMLVSVAERTREIGIRKALGATNGDIVWQFLIESLALSIGGGIAGYALGYALAFIISTFLTFGPILTWQIAVIALGISIIMGTLFGIYPALRAASKDPIDSLREYN
jgi:putative ABC transport system permease protein